MKTEAASGPATDLTGRFAIGLIKARGLEVAQTLHRKLNRNVRCVFDVLKMANTQPLPNRW